MHVSIDLNFHKLATVPPSRPNDSSLMVIKILGLTPLHQTTLLKSEPHKGSSTLTEDHGELVRSRQLGEARGRKLAASVTSREEAVTLIIGKQILLPIPLATTGIWEILRSVPLARVSLTQSRSRRLSGAVVALFL
uniref:Uncharacterized protein n=1 Tax=Fagus sylvatica TaxID=28930 RepID=A0A2N9G337_FAGSY